MLTVAAILKEPVAVTLRFAAWYLDQGADRVRLFFDDPSDPAIPLVQDHPGIDAQPCTQDFWDRVGIAPDARFTRRQNLALTVAYRETAEGWFLNVDADELVWLEHAPLGDFLAAQEADVLSVCFRTAEAVQTPGTPGTHFRLPIPRRARAAIYGEGGNVLMRRGGLVGHDDGKTAVRAGMPGLVLRQHWAQYPDGTRVPARDVGPAQGGYLLHFFDRGYESWRAKLDWRRSSYGFRPEIRDELIALREGPDPEAALRALYEAAHVFDPGRVRLLAEAGSHLGRDYDFDAPVARHFPGAGTGA